MKLYKYVHWRPFNKECDLNKDCSLITKCYTQENLLNSSFFLNSPQSMNDPFDTLPFVKAANDYKTIKKFLIQTIKETENVSKEIATRRAMHRLEKDYNFKNTNHWQETAEKIVSNIRSCTGICCFTTNEPETLLMWAHYGDKHEGICLEFEFTEHNDIYDMSKSNEKPVISIPQEVVYSHDLPIFNAFTSNIEEMSKCFLTKSKDWDYEHEYRIMSKDYIGPIAYKPHLLTRIYAGYKMASPEFDELQKTIRKMKIQPKLYQLEKSKKQFSLERIKI